MNKGNVLFITMDQVAASSMHGPLAACVPTPNFDRFAGQSAVFRNHSSVTAPCGPARASLHTGLYAMNHRSIRNGTPLARHHATVATEARKAGYEPLLFGYSDATRDPEGVDPEDPDRSMYEGVTPGFRELVELRLDEGYEWPAYLRSRGYEFDLEQRDPVAHVYRPAATAHNRPSPIDPAIYAASDSETAYLTNRTLSALDVRRDRPWFAHIAFIRPHPPLIAATPYNTLVDPASVPSPDLERVDHPFMDAWFSEPSKASLFWGFDGDCSKIDDALARELRAVYLGLLAEVDAHFGRITDWLDKIGQADRTLVVLTADHGEMLGGMGLWGKDCVFEDAYHVPLLIRDPRGGGAHEVAQLTESVDVMPTVLDWIGVPVQPAVDGCSLLPMVAGETPPGWRDSAFMEVDFGHPDVPTRFQRHLGLAEEQSGVSILREARWKYVHFGGGIEPMLFDLEADPGETGNLAADPARAAEVSRMARKMIDRMTERRDRRLTGFSFGV